MIEFFVFVPSCLGAFVPALGLVPLSDITWGLAAFALGWLAINFAEGYEHLAVNIRYACGRREMRDVLCDPHDRAALARELTRGCYHCSPQSEPGAQATGPPPSVPSCLRASVPVTCLGDHDGE